MAPSNLGNIGPFLEALRYDPCLLFRRPPPPAPLPGDQLDTTIRTAFLPGIKHGICHRFTPNDQLMQGCIADQAHDREVGASCRLRFIEAFADPAGGATLTKTSRTAHCVGE